MKLFLFNLDWFSRRPLFFSFVRALPCMGQRLKSIIYIMKTLFSCFPGQIDVGLGTLSIRKDWNNQAKITKKDMGFRYLLYRKSTQTPSDSVLSHNRSCSISKCQISQHWLYRDEEAPEGKYIIGQPSPAWPNSSIPMGSPVERTNQQHSC